jgi:hypothetical protein
VIVEEFGEITQRLKKEMAREVIASCLGQMDVLVAGARERSELWDAQPLEKKVATVTMHLIKGDQAARVATMLALFILREAGVDLSEATAVEGDRG